MIPRLVLIAPPQAGLLRGFSTGLASIQDYVGRHLPDSEPDVADLSEEVGPRIEATVAEIVARKSDRPMLVGIATTTASYQMSLRVARAVKAGSPVARVVLGGHHAGSDFETVLQHHSDVVDAVVIGEGEIPMLQMLRAWPDLRHVPGIAFRARDGRLVKAPLPALIDQEELDRFPAVWDVDGFGSAPGKFHHATYVSARGCPLGCAFCAVANERIRSKSVARVQHDVRALVAKGFSRIAIEDNFFAHSPQRTRQICEALRDLRQREHLAFAWDCQTRVESLARENTLALMAEAGCEAVYIGVESVVAEQLLYLRKTAAPQRYLRQLIDIVVPQVLASPIECFINLQLGLPLESQLQIESALGVIRDLGTRAHRKGKVITIFPMLHVVYPGTQHFYDGVANGRYSRDIFESFTEWELDQSPILTWLGEHFAHGTGGIPVGILDETELRSGRFRIDRPAVDRIDRGLRSMAAIPGIRVFAYGAHLVRSRVAGAIGNPRLQLLRTNEKSNV